MSHADKALVEYMRGRLRRLPKAEQDRFLLEARTVSPEASRAAEVLARELGLSLPTGTWREER